MIYKELIGSLLEIKKKIKIIRRNEMFFMFFLF